MQQSKYLVVNERDAQWGLAVSTVGYEEIGIGEEYPTHGHAEGYYFNVSKGRVLNEYQLLALIPSAAREGMEEVLDRVQGTKHRQPRQAALSLA